MNVITLSREFGAGGGELARQLAQALGWEVLDRELLHQAAQVEHVPDAELERLDEKAVSTADRFRLRPPHQKYLHGLTAAVRAAAARGQVILVGRGARQLLGDLPGAFHLRIVAPRDWRIQRMARIEGCSPEQALARCLEVDRTRARFNKYFFGSTAQSAQYDLVANTGRLALEDVVAGIVAALQGSLAGNRQGDKETRRQGEESGNSSVSLSRLLTLARELGAGETGFAPTLAARLDLPVFDREHLEQEAKQLGISEAEVEQIDEQPSGIFQRFRPGSIHQRYLDALKQIMADLAKRGTALVVGRAGSRFWKDLPQAFHVRLVAPMDIRVRRVMEYRWLRESGARSLIAQSDKQRYQFLESCFGANWADPLEYHVTVNSGRLGPMAVDLIAFLAEKHWQRPQKG